jgi:hypothetical protein
LVANGTKRHFAAAQQTVAFGGKAVGQRAQNDANDALQRVLDNEADYVTPMDMLAELRDDTNN